MRGPCDDALRELFSAISAMWAATKVLYGIRARLHVAGHQPNSWVLLDELPLAVAALGDPEQVGVTQAWRFAEKLRERGVL